MNLTFRQFELRTRHPFTISRGTTTVARTLVVELEQDGVRGYGEAPESVYYGATIERMTAALRRAPRWLEWSRLGDPADLWPRLHPEFRGAPFLQAALDAAAHDLWGKLRGAPVWKLWGLSLDAAPPSDYTIGLDTIDVMVKKLAEFPGFPVYKIKLGVPGDLEIVRGLRRHTDAVFRVDANGGWTADEAMRKARVLADLGVEFIEQPLPPGRWDDMRRLYRRAALPLVADESWFQGATLEKQIERCAECFHGINIKPAKCGGLTPARRMIARARQLGLKVMVGCFEETAVGISAAAQLLPLVDYADLDGALLLADDIAQGVRIEQGRVVFPEENGCGVQMLPEERERDG